MCFAFGRTVILRAFEYHAPTSLNEALSLLQELGEAARPLAGGTDLVVQMKENATKFAAPSHIVNLLRVPELGGIEFSESVGLRIGAGATMAEVAATLSIAGNRVERARVALGAVAPTPVRARRAEGALEGQPPSDDVFARAAEIAAMECSPIADVRASAEFRRYIVRVMTMRMLREVRDRARSG